MRQHSVKEDDMTCIGMGGNMRQGKMREAS